MAKRDPPRDVPPAPRPFGLAASAARFTHPFTPRAAALACGALLLSVCLFAYSGSRWVVVVYQLATDGALLAAWLLASLGLGAFLLRVFRLAEQDRSRVLLPVVTSIALGLGVLSLAALGLGLCGLLNRITALGLIGLGILLAVIAALSYRSRHRPGEVDAAVRAWLAAPAGWAWLWLAVMPLLAIAIVGAMVPPGALWTPDEPHGYDVVEYHLQVPREWYEAGRILPLRHNVFSYFPFGVEMHYLLAMHLSGGPWHGMYLAQMMHGAHVVLAVLAVYAFARTPSRSRASAVFAGVMAASVPWLTLLAPIAYNEGSLLLYGMGLGAAAVLGPLLATGDAPDARRANLAGALAGVTVFVLTPHATGWLAPLRVDAVAAIAQYPALIAAPAAWLVAMAIRSSDAARAEMVAALRRH